MKRLSFPLLLILLLSLLSSCVHTKAEPVVVGLAWRNDRKATSYQCTIASLERAGATVILLPEVKSGALLYREDGELSDDHLSWLFDLSLEAAESVKEEGYDELSLEELLRGIDLVVFAGGEDISASLYLRPEWTDNGMEYCNATRDVSDYLLMSYCLDHDVPVLGICRGMQMLSVVSGATMIQELGEWYGAQGISYNFEHRMEESEHRRYVPHAVDITEGSILSNLTEGTHLEGVPSWHHQAVESAEGTNLLVTATTETLGCTIVEGVERTDKTFAAGVQFHPEIVAAGTQREEDLQGLMDEETALAFFRNVLTLVQSRKWRKAQGK